MLFEQHFEYANYCAVKLDSRTRPRNRTHVILNSILYCKSGRGRRINQSWVSIIFQEAHHSDEMPVGRILRDNCHAGLAMGFGMLLCVLEYQRETAAAFNTKPTPINLMSPKLFVAGSGGRAVANFACFSGLCAYSCLHGFS